MKYQLPNPVLAFAAARAFRKSLNLCVALALVVLLAGITPPAAFAQTLTQTIDLSTWTGTPVQIVQPPPPPPAPPFSLVSIAFDPVSNTLYAADHATTIVYAIDGTTNSVTSAVYTNGLFSTQDIGPQIIPVVGPNTVHVNSATNRWLFVGQGGGAQFSGTTLAESVNARAQQGGSAWDPVTGDLYAADGLEFFAANNLKFLAYNGSGCNTTTLNVATSRVYVSCGGGVAVYDGVALSKAKVKIPTPPIGNLLGIQATGLAVNPNTNRLYAMGMSAPNSLDVFDASTYQPLASIPGLPDQTGDVLVAAYFGLALPRPIAVNTLTNTIFVLNSVDSTISVIDGNTNTLTATIPVPVPPGSIVSQVLPPNTQMFEIKAGNTFFNAPSSTLTTLGGAIAMAVNEGNNLLYEASVNGTIGVYSLPSATQPPLFSLSGTIKDAKGVATPGVTVNVKSGNGTATAITDSTGLYVVTGLPAGGYSVAPSSAQFSFKPASRSITITNSNATLVTFTAGPAVSYTLSVGKSNTGTVTSSPSGIDCGGTCSAKFPSGTSVTLTATPPQGKTFSKWGGACRGTQPNCTVVMTKNTAVKAVFNK
jgi:YVTN family beta-propeller protein